MINIQLSQQQIAYIGQLLSQRPLAEARPLAEHMEAQLAQYEAQQSKDHEDALLERAREQVRREMEDEMEREGKPGEAET